MNRRRDLVSARLAAEMRKDDSSACPQRRSEVPLAPGVEQVERACFAQFHLLLNNFRFEIGKVEFHVYSSSTPFPSFLDF